MDIIAYNNTVFRLTLDLTAIAAAYDLSGVEWRAHVRPTPSSPIVTLAFSSSDETAAGDMSYDGLTKLLFFEAPRSAVRTFTGSYSWDFGFTPAGGEFVRLDGGSAEFIQGVTR